MYYIGVLVFILTSTSLAILFSTLFADTSLWREEEVDEDIDFLTWLQRTITDDGKTCHIESIVNLNRQRERLSRAREKEVRRIYETCKDMAYDYKTKCNITPGGVRYGFVMFSMDMNEPYETEVMITIITNKNNKY